MDAVGSVLHIGERPARAVMYREKCNACKVHLCIEWRARLHYIMGNVGNATGAQDLQGPSPPPTFLLHFTLQYFDQSEISCKICDT